MKVSVIEEATTGPTLKTRTFPGAQGLLVLLVLLSFRMPIASRR